MQTQTYNSQFTQFNAEEGQVELANATSEAVSNIAAVVVQQKEKQDNLKILNYQAQADIEANKVVNEWRNINAENPNDETANKELDMKLDEIYNKYESNLGIFAKGKWRQVKDLTKNKYKNDNIKWTMAQNMKNADKNLNAVIDSTVSQGYQIGLTGDANPIEVLNQRKEMIRQGAEGLLPADKITESLKTFESDFTRNYLVGLSERSPDQAMKLLENEQIKSSLQVKGGEDMVKEMKRLMNVQKDTQKLKIEKQQLENSFSFDKAQENMTLGQQLTDLESGALTGKYNEKWAKNKREMLLSSSQGETNADAMNEFISAIYLIPEMYENSGESKDFINNVSELRANIVGSKELSNSDKKKLEKELISAIKKPQAKAIEEISSETIYANAKRVFERTLPIEKRSLAMVEYFRKTQGIELTPDQQKVQLNGIVEKIQSNGREQAKTIMNKKNEIKKVAEEFGVDYNKLQAIADRKGLSVEIIRERLSKAKK